MHIVNVMFGREFGGIEQSFMDYCTAIERNGAYITAIIHPDAKIKKQLQKLAESHKRMQIIEVSNRGQWDIFAVRNIRKVLQENKPDAVIAHGNRAITLMKKASKYICPVVGVAHNYNIKRLPKLDAVFTITQDLRGKVSGLGIDIEKVYHIPNMIEVGEMPKINPFRKPPIIGTMGRMVKKKGFDIFIEAMVNLKKNDIDFKAIIGGVGEEQDNLKKLANEKGITDKVEFIGWVEDKAEFFREIDIFCLPSLHEPFGIVLLEAFVAAKPVVTSDTEGPTEIVTDGIDAVFVEKGNAKDMAYALADIIADEKNAAILAKNGYKTVKQLYDTAVIGKKIDSGLKEIIEKYQNDK